MQTRRIGDHDVSAIGLGAMPLTMDQRPTEEDAIATVHAALDAGVTLIDTADAYTWAERGPGANEEVVAKALASYGGSTDHVLVATKGGHTRDGADWGLDGRPEYLRRACEASLRRLGVEAIGLYQHHRPDPDVPYEETMGGLKDLYDAGLIQRAGISNADPDQIRLAQKVLGDALVSVQNQFSPRFRSSEPEIGVCEDLGLAFLPWSPLGGIAQSQGPRLVVRRVRRGRGRAGRLAPADLPRVGARAVPVRGPDPRREPPGVDPVLGCGRRHHLERRRNGPLVLSMAKGPSSNLCNRRDTPVLREPHRLPGATTCTSVTRVSPAWWGTDSGTPSPTRRGRAAAHVGVGAGDP